MIITNTSSGNNVTALNGQQNELLRGSVHATSETDVVTKPTQGAKTNVLASLVCCPSLTTLYHFYDNHSGRFDEETTFDRWSRADDDRPRGIGSAGLPAASMDRNMSGEDAYMRRLAMSQGAAPPRAPSPPPVHVDRNMDGEEAYQRRLALATGDQPAETASQPVSQPADDVDLDVALGDDVTEPPAVSVDRAETGDEAYQRRLALSQGLRPTVSPFIPSQPPPMPSSVAEPPSPPRSAYNPFAPPTNVPPPPGQFPSGLEDRVKAAANIAARLSALAPPVGASSAGSGDSGTDSPAPPPPMEEEGASKRSALSNTRAFGLLK